MSEDDYEKFSKWQGITREQLGATSNLVFGLSTGLLGFTTFFLLDKSLVACALGFGVAAMAILALSVALALWCALNRLSDFRLTAQIAHPKHRSAVYIEEWREKSSRLGEKTWIIFHGQIWSFAIGAGAISIGVLIQVFSCA